MKSAQHNGRGLVLIHPTACSNLATIRAFQTRTGLKVIISDTGKAHAVTCAGGVA